MSEIPYRSVAVASTFSPRFEQVLAEGKRISERFGAKLSLIYVGERTAETEAKFTGAMTALGLPPETPVIYQSGEPAVAIMAACEANGVDLLVAGALEKEVVLRPFLGDVARRLIREAKCSVILFPRPEREPKPLRRMVYLTDYSEHGLAGLRRSWHLALREQAEMLYVVRVYTPFDRARAALGVETEQAEAKDPAMNIDDEETALEQFILSAGPTEVPMEARCVRGNTGGAASDFVQAINADLLIVPAASDGSGAALLPRRVAWVTDVIPCILWVIR